jgi:hypothetical protein
MTMTIKGKESPLKIDITGKSFGKWTVLKYARFEQGTARWTCKCECGTVREVDGRTLRRGVSTSCGCTNKLHVEIGQKFNRWTVVSYVGLRSFSGSEYSQPFYLCHCACGTEHEVGASALVCGHSKSCGCFSADLTTARNKSLRLPQGEPAFNALFARYKKGAENRGFEFSISEERFRELVKCNCAYCGTAPFNVMKTTTGSYTYSGLDRKDNTLGYTEINTAPCCKTCNLAKRTMTLSQFNEWLDRILKFRTNLKEAALQPEEINAIPDYSI